MRELTKAEEQVMQVLWELNEGYVKDIIEKLPEPKPAYNTVSTIVRILEEKGFIGHKHQGKTYLYHPLVERDSYRTFFLKSIVGRHFGGSFKNMVSFFAHENNLNLQEFEQLLNKLDPPTQNPDQP